MNDCTAKPSRTAEGGPGGAGKITQAQIRVQIASLGADTVAIGFRRCVRMYPPEAQPVRCVPCLCPCPLLLLSYALSPRVLKSSVGRELLRDLGKVLEMGCDVVEPESSLGCLLIRGMELRDKLRYYGGAVLVRAVSTFW